MTSGAGTDGAGRGAGAVGSVELPSEAGVGSVSRLESVGRASADQLQVAGVVRAGVRPMGRELERDLAEVVGGLEGVAVSGEWVTAWPLIGPSWWTA